MAGVKLSAEVNGFKNAMKQAQSSVKMLDAELKLNTAQYKASGDSEEYMAGRARLLSQQITQQEAAVKAAEDALRQMTAEGVDKASVAYTQMQAAVAKARTDLVNLQSAAANAGDGLGDMAEAGESANQSLSSIDKGMKFQNIKSALDSITSMLTGMVQKALEFGDAVWDWGRNAASWADDLNTTAKMYGMDAETLQSYQYAAALVDTSVDDMIKSTDKLTQKIKNAEDGYLAITTETTAYAIAVKDAQGNMRSQSDMMWDFLDILSQVGNETERNILAQEYFGKSYRELIPLIEAGRDGWAEAASGAKIVSQDDVNKLNDYNDSLDEFDQHLNAMKMQIFADLAPALGEITDALTRMVDRIGEWAASDEGRATLDRLGQAVANLIDSFANGDFETLFNNATEAVGKIAEWLSTITSEDIMTALKTIGTIIAGWTIGSKLLEFMVFAKAMGIGGGSGGGGGSSALPGKGGGGFNWAGFAVNAAQLGAGAFMLHEMNAESQEDRWEYQAQSWAYNQAKKGGAGGAVGKLVNWLVGDPELQNYWKSNEVAQQSASELDARFIEAMRVAGYDPNFAFSLEAAVAELTRAATGHEEKVTQWGVDSAGGLVGIDVNGNIVPINDSALMDAAAWRARTSKRAQEQGYEYWLGHDTSSYSGKGEYDGYEWNNFINNFGGVNFGKYYAEETAEGVTANAEQMSAAGAELSESAYEGMLANIGAAYAAGGALAAAFASGAAAGAGSGGSTYNSEFINSVNVYGATNPAEIAAAYRSYMQQTQAGVGN